MRNKPTLVSILIAYLKEKRGEVVHGGQLEAVAKANFYEAEPAKVRLREMTRENCRQFNPMIEKVKLRDGCVAYRWRQERETVVVDRQPLVEATLF
jgi:hypothetical protein